MALQVIAVFLIISNFCYNCQTPLTYALAYLPILQQKFGPLYDAIEFLISDEQANAATVWQETSQQLNHSVLLLSQASDKLAHYNPIEHLKSLNDITKNPNFYHCYKSHEREIAHFDRELIGKYEICKQILNVATSHLQQETFEEINFLRNATWAIERVPVLCKVKDLKYAHKNHAGILLCIISHLGEIDQRLLEAPILVLDIIAEIAYGADIDADDSCHTYNELQMEFDDIFAKINRCVNEI